MNLIEAWNKARGGQRLTRESNSVTVYKEEKYIVEGQFRIGGDKNNLSYMTHSNLLAEDWKIVKEKKRVVIEGMAWRRGAFGNVTYPIGTADWTGLLSKPSMKMTLEWEE